MSDKKTTLTWLLRDEVSATARKVNGQLESMGVKAKGTTGILGKLGKATGGLLTPTNLLAGGVFAAAGAFVDFTKAAIDEEVGINRLNTSLKANAKGWDGDTAAIEAAIAKAEDWSAFSDDDLRNSLALIVGATHDVSKAFDVQKVAMDLARFKGIDLATATDALTKVEGGSYRILKSLGIQLPKTATQVEALAAVEAVAAGQAQTYADSHAGAWDKIGNRIQDAKEGVGDFILAVVDGAPKAAEGFNMMAESFLPFFKDLEGARTAVEGFTGAIAKGKVAGLPSYVDTTPSPIVKPKHRATGGWVGQNGPEIVLAGEKGPEYITPANQSRGGDGGFTIRGVSEREIVAMVDRGLYFKLSRASPSAMRK